MNEEELIKILEDYEIFVDDDYGSNYQSIIYYDKEKKISKAHTTISALKIIETFNKLQKENKILKENAENNDKVVDKVNWENQLLKKENEQLKKRLEKIDNILNYCKFEIKKEKDKFPCPLESEQWLKGRISAFEEILQVEKSDK